MPGFVCFRPDPHRPTLRSVVAFTGYNPTPEEWAEEAAYHANLARYKAEQGLRVLYWMSALSVGLIVALAVILFKD